ncbi:hypothetical protein BH10BAC5_BH10BAC5_16990 [soil metagenome]
MNLRDFVQALFSYNPGKDTILQGGNGLNPILDIDVKKAFQYASGSIYIARISQVSTDDPVVNDLILRLPLGIGDVGSSATAVYSRSGVGSYKLKLTGIASPAVAKVYVEILGSDKVIRLGTIALANSNTEIDIPFVTDDGLTSSRETFSNALIRVIYL